MTNLRGRVATMGNRAKHTTKQAKAPKLHPAKTSKRSHLLTVDPPTKSVSEIPRDVTNMRGAAEGNFLDSSHHVQDQDMVSESGTCPTRSGPVCCKGN